MIARLQPKIEQFLQQANQGRIYRAWIEDDFLKIYLRKSWRPGIGICLDIASIEIHEEHRRQGLFAALAEWLHEKNPYEATYIEHSNVLISLWCVRNAWLIDTHSNPISFYMPKNLKNPKL